MIKITFIKSTYINQNHHKSTLSLQLSDHDTIEQRKQNPKKKIATYVPEPNTSKSTNTNNKFYENNETAAPTNHNLAPTRHPHAVKKKKGRKNKIK